jgi:hypothetical protein
MNYKLEIKTDNEFDIKYNGKSTKYDDYFSIIFKSKTEKLNARKVLEILNKIEFVERKSKNRIRHNIFSLNDTKDDFIRLKSQILKGFTRFHSNNLYSLTFEEICEDADDVVDV